jgi:hypothetical protein
VAEPFHYRRAVKPLAPLALRSGLTTPAGVLLKGGHISQPVATAPPST